MGVDLRLLPVEYLCDNPDGSQWGYSHAVLSLPRCRAAWPDFESMKPVEVPPSADISSFCGKRVPDGRAQGELMYGRLRATDSYGSPYTWSTAEQLIPVLERHFADCPVTAYIKALKPSTRVVLDWH